MLRESVTYVIAREEIWKGQAVSEPVEAGWATEAVFFLRATDTPKGDLPQVRAQISPDGMRWVDEGATTALPKSKEDIAFIRIRHFGNWVRLSADLPDGANCALLVTVHLK